MSIDLDELVYVYEHMVRVPDNYLQEMLERVWNDGYTQGQKDGFVKEQIGDTNV